RSEVPPNAGAHQLQKYYVLYNHLPEKIIIFIMNSFAVMLKYYFFLVIGIFLVIVLMFSYVSEFHKAHAFPLGGGGGASPPQLSSGGSPQISSGKTSPPQLSSGGSPQI